MIPKQGWFLREFSFQLQKEAVDPRSIQAAAASLVSRQQRSFEVFWDGSEFRLFFGSSTPWDLDFMTKVYSQHIMIGLPAERAEGKIAIPCPAGSKSSTPPEPSSSS
jgi:hypothetical protein